LPFLPKAQDQFEFNRTVFIVNKTIYDLSAYKDNVVPVILAKVYVRRKNGSNYKFLLKKQEDKTMGTFSERNVEHNIFYSPEDAPTGFAIEDGPVPFETQAPSQQQTITAVQFAAVEDTLEMSVDTASTSSDEYSGAGVRAEAGKRAEDEDAKRKAHEETEAKRKAVFDDKQAANQAAEQEQLAKVAAMSDEEVLDRLHAAGQNGYGKID